MAAGQKERERTSQTKAQCADFRSRRRVLVVEFGDGRFEVGVGAIEFEFLRKPLGGDRIFCSAAAKQIRRQGYETRPGQPIANVANELGQSPLVVDDDDPTTNGGGLAMWLSHRDTAQIHVKAVDAPDSLMYTVVFAMSDNEWNIFSLDKAREVLGYEPQDDAGHVLNLNRKMLERDDTDF